MMVAVVAVISSLAELQVSDSFGGRNSLFVYYYWIMMVALVVVISSLVKLQVNDNLSSHNAILVFYY